MRRGPVTTVSFSADDGDVDRYFLYAMIFVNNDGAYFPALSENLTH